MTAFIIIPLVILWAYLHGRYTQQKHELPPMLMHEPRQCVQGFKRLARRPSYSLPALTEEDRL